MNKEPYFSIVIPTKNRPRFLNDSIQSVLLQHFKDYELIISDNCNEKETQDIIKKYIGNPHVISIRTESELNMLDHWEFATSKARGKYVIVLADRKLLCQNALKKIYKLTLKYNTINVFSFGFQVYDEDKKQIGWSVAIGKTKIFKATDLVVNFLNENIFSPRSLDVFFPKNTHGFFRNSFAKDVRNKFGNYFNNKNVTTPDYSSFFINCSLNKEILYIGEKIVLSQGEKISNGRNFGKGNHEQYMKSLGVPDPYKNVPIQAPLVFSLLSNDFIIIKSIFKGNLDPYELNIENYFRTNYYEILKKRELGLSENALSFFMESWKEAISRYIFLNKEQMMESVEAELKYVNTHRKPGDKIVRFGHHLKDYLALRYSAKSLLNKVIQFRFNNSLEAAGFKINK